jgi:hypothetical protein
MAGLIVDPQRLTTDDDGLAALITVPECGDAITRLQVYANGYPARIEEALAETFPALEHVVGAGAFAALCHRFAGTVPLHSYSLSDAGEALPQFLRSDPLTSSLPFLTDLARLEWCVTRAFHATDEAPFDPSSLAHWSLDDWEHAVLRFQPWVALVESEWPVREIWEASDTPIEQIDIDLCGRADYVLVRREGFAVICESVGAAEAHALRLLLHGESLGSAVAALAQKGEEAASVSTWLARWVTLRMIAGCTHCPSQVE